MFTFLILPFREDPVTEERGNKEVGSLNCLMRAAIGYTL